jgi:hypothetical protein
MTTVHQTNVYMHKQKEALCRPNKQEKSEIITYPSNLPYLPLFTLGQHDILRDQSTQYMDFLAFHIENVAPTTPTWKNIQP